MLRLFLKDTFVYAIGVFSIRLINFLLMPYLTRKLSPSDYGIITLILTLSAIVLYVLTLQISQAIPKYCANNQNTLEKTTYASTGFYFVVLAYLMLYLLAFVFPVSTQWVLGISNEPVLLHLSMLNICLFGIFTYLETQLRWDKKVLAYTTVSFIIMLASLIFITALVHLNLGLKGYLIGNAIAQLIGCLLAFFYGRNNYRFVFSKLLLYKMINFSFPLSISAIAGYAYANLSHWLIRIFCDLDALGLYGVSSRFSSIVSIALGCISLSITPLIYAEYKNKDMQYLITFLFRVCMLVALWCSAIFIVFQEQILTVFVGRAFFAAGAYIPFILLSYTFSSLYIFSPGQWIFSKTKELAAVNIIIAIINFCVAIVLIKNFLIWGAVIGLFVASLFQLALNIYFSNKYYPLDYQLKNVVAALTLFILFFFIPSNVVLLLAFMATTLLLLINKQDIYHYILKPLQQAKLSAKS